ncbi:MAG: hypothetical protein IGS39_22135 [Calothrix sp. C42_A2020_038]|nr:hypothetical protein [Calothrix sp. C42_A2020_038]
MAPISRCHYPTLYIIDPLFDNIEASLRSSGKVGRSVLAVRVQEADPLPALLALIIIPLKALVPKQ